MSASTTVRAALVAFLLALGATSAHAQAPAGSPPPHEVTIRLVAMRAAGEKKGGPDDLPPALAAWQRTLAELGFASYALVNDLTWSGPFGQKASFDRFDGASPRHIVDVEATSDPDGRIALSVVVARWPVGGPPTPAARPERVVTVPLRVESGSHFAVQVRDAFAVGDHLVLLISATRVVPLVPPPPGTPPPPATPPGSGGGTPGG